MHSIKQKYYRGFPSGTVDRKVKVTHSCPTLWDPNGLNSPWNSPGQTTGMGSRSLLQGIFPTQGLNPGLPHCRQILYQLSHKGNSRILEWVAYHSSSRSFWPTNPTGSPALQADSLPAELSRKPQPVDMLQEGSTCCKATKPAHHNYRAHTLKLVCCNYWSPHT